MKHPLPTSMALAAALLLSACATAPRFESAPQPINPPAAWTQLAGSGSGLSSNLSLAGDDAQLAALQERALKANRDIAQALKRWDSAKLQQRGAGLDRGLTPSLSGSASGSRLVEQGPVSRSYSLSAGLSYEVDLWKRLSHAEAAQVAQTESARSDVAAAQLLIRSRVAEAYWTLASLALEAPLVAAQQRDAQTVLEATRARVREGKLLPIEVDKAAGTVQSLAARMAQLDRERIQQQLTLGLLLDELQPELPQSPAMPTTLPLDWQPGSPAEVLARRPDVQRARAQVDAALAQLKATEAARYPRLSLSAGISTGGNQWQDWLERPLASLAANLIVPLVDWRRLDLQQAQAGNQLDIAALALRDTLHKALVEVEQLAAQRRELREQLAANALRLAEAKKTESLAQLRYEVGAIARADWLQARNARLSAEQESLQLRLRAWLNHSALKQALAES